MKNPWTIILLLLSISCGAWAQGFKKTMERQPDTGQKASYTNVYGEDSDYTIHPPAYQLPGNGTVVDSVTGLMWQQTDGGEMTFEQAQQYVQNLTLAGHDDWRLPTGKEAFSIFNHDQPNPALNGSVFPASGAQYWWTSDVDVTNSNKVWVTNAGGGIGNHPKSETLSAGGTKKFHVRAVRDQSAPGLISNLFVQNSDSTVIDQLSGWVWFPYAAPDTLSWEEALQYAENLTAGGYSDWRLPNIKELQSLSDPLLANPCVDASIFPGTGIRKYWSSTSLPNQTGKAWYLDTRFGITTYEFKTREFHVLCVRGDGNGLTSTGEHGSDLEKEIRPYPNPFKNQIRLAGRKPLPQAQLLDLFGHILYHGDSLEEQDFSKLPAGMYVLRLETKPLQTIKLTKL